MPSGSTGSGASAGLALPRRRPRRKVRTGARLTPLADRPNAVWTYDFIHDAAANGLRFKCLTVVDEYTRECLAITVERSLPARRVLAVLGQLVARYGPPGYLRSDNGPEFIARRVRQWLALHRHHHRLHRPGQAVAERGGRELPQPLSGRMPG